MTVLVDARELKQRFGTYIDRFQELFQEHRIEGKNWYVNFRLAWHDPKFKANWDSIWNEVLEQNAGKLSLGAALGIVGAAVGSIGIAGFGGAIGVPLALLGAPLGLVLGNEFDAGGATKGVVGKIRQLFVGSATKDSQDDAPDSADEEFAVLLELVGETTNRCVALEQEHVKLKADIATLSDQVISLKHRLDATQSEIRSLRHHILYLRLGVLFVALVLISGLVWRFLH